MHRLYHAGQMREAAALGWELLRADPYDTVLLNLLALAEHQLGNHGAALVLLQRAIKAKPEVAAHWNDIGNVYIAVGDLDASENAYKKALACDPKCAEIYNNLGVLAGDRKQFEQAREWYEKALALRPHYPDVLCNMGIIFAHMGKYQKAVRRYEQSLKLQPDLHKAHFNLALVRLVLGDLAGGWKEWDSRWKNPQLAPSYRDWGLPAWKGEPLEGRPILLYAEQGLGDTLQFVRYVPLVAARGGTVVLEVQKALVPLIAPMMPEWAAHRPGRFAGSGEAVVMAQHDPLPPFATHCALMSLPIVFGTTLNSIPHAEGYLRAPVGGGRPADDRLRVGLVWAGSPTHKLDYERSIALEKLRPLLEVEGVRWVSLQKGPAVATLKALAATDQVFGLVEDAASAFENYADTAEAVHGLDLVITVDTSVAHLAGAMGKRVWILLQHTLSDWRWLLKRKDSPWYKSARLFRQPAQGDWGSVVEAVRSELLELRKTYPVESDGSR